MEIIECPYCGGENQSVYVEEVNSVDKTAYHIYYKSYVKCLGCEASTVPIFGEDMEEIERASITAWNKRQVHSRKPTTNELDVLKQLVNIRWREGYYKGMLEGMSINDDVPEYIREKIREVFDGDE